MNEPNCPVSCPEACEDICRDKVPVDCPTEPGKVGAVAVPAFLLPIAEQLIAEYGPAAVAYLQKAVEAGIRALAEKYNIVPKAS